MPPTVPDAFDHFLLSLEAQGRAARTIESYRERLGPFLEKHQAKRVSEVTPADVDGWVVALRRQKRRHENNAFRAAIDGGLSTATIATRVQCLKTFLKWCVARGYLERSPGGHLKRIVRVHAISSEKVMKRGDLVLLLAAAKERPRDYALLLFLADTGARVGEVASMTLGKLHLETLEAEVTGKTGRRTVYFTERTADGLRGWLALRPACDNQRLWVGELGNHRGRPLRVEGMRQVLRRLADRAGVSGRYNPQAIRHLVGQAWADATNLELVRQKLGHKDIQVTAAFYAHQDSDRLKAATERLSLVVPDSESES